MSIRYYGESYSSSLETSISNAIDSIDSTTYSSAISSTTVKPKRYALRNTCASAAIDAYGQVSGVKTKLGKLRTGLVSFYGDVDETSLSIHQTAIALKSVLVSINITLSNLNDLLSGTGDYKGITVTASDINNIGATLSEGADVLTEYYKNSFLNSDGSLNMDEVEDYCKDYDAKIADGSAEELSNYYRTQGFVLATEDRLSRCENDDEFTQVVNELMEVFYVQDQTTTGSWEGPSEDYIYPDAAVFFKYSFRPSAQLFSASYRDDIQKHIDELGLYGYNYDNYNCMRFADTLLLIDQNFNYITYPVLVDKDYREYRQAQFGGEIGESTAGDANDVIMPFPGFDFKTVECGDPPETHTRISWRDYGDNKSGTQGYFIGLSYDANNGILVNDGPLCGWVDICTCNDRMSDEVKSRVVNSAIAYAESNRQTVGEVIAQNVYTAIVHSWQAFLPGGPFVGIAVGAVTSVADGLMQNHWNNQGIDEFEEGFLRDVNTYKYYMNLGGPTGSYYIFNYVEGEEYTPVVYRFITKPYDTQLILGYDALPTQENPSGSSVLVYGTPEAEEVLKNKDLQTNGDFYNYYAQFAIYLQENNLDPNTMTQEELVEAIEDFNSTYTHT